MSSLARKALVSGVVFAAVVWAAPALTTSAAPPAGRALVVSAPLPIEPSPVVLPELAGPMVAAADQFFGLLGQSVALERGHG
jgi:hypothetical protein